MHPAWWPVPGSGPCTPRSAEGSPTERAGDRLHRMRFRIRESPGAESSRQAERKRWCLRRAGKRGEPAGTGGLQRLLRKPLHEPGGHRDMRSQHGSALRSGCVHECQETARWWTHRWKQLPPCRRHPRGPECGACGGLGGSDCLEGSVGG